MCRCNNLWRPESGPNVQEMPSAVMRFRSCRIGHESSKMSSWEGVFPGYAVPYDWRECGVALQGFKALQEALLLVHALPHAPDVFALVKELAAVAGEPTAEQLLREGAGRPHERAESSDGPALQLEERMEKAISTLELDGFVEKLR